MKENIKGKKNYKKRVNKEKVVIRESMLLHRQFERNTKTLKKIIGLDAKR